jgi:hypothetical protein
VILGKAEEILVMGVKVDQDKWKLPPGELIAIEMIGTDLENNFLEKC